MTDPTARPRLGRRYSLAAILFVVGMMLGPLTVVITVFRSIGELDRAVRLSVPGETYFPVTKPSRCIIWDETPRQFGTNAPYAVIPTWVKVRVTGPDGSDIPVQSSGVSSYTSGTVERNSVFQFDAGTPGEYRVQAFNDSASRTFAVSHDVLGGLWKMIVLCLICGVLGASMVLAALVLLTLTIIAQVRQGSMPKAAASV